MSRFTVRFGCVLVLLSTACNAGMEDPAEQASPQALQFPVTPPTVITPYTACAGPSWDPSCDAIILLREPQAIVGPGRYDCITGCAGLPSNRVSVPNFAGWVQSRANANDWRRAYRLPIAWARDLAAAICSPTQSGCAVAYVWPLADGTVLRLSLAFLNDDDMAPATDGTIRSLSLMQETADRIASSRHDDLYSLATTTYAATAARQAVFTSIPGGPPIISYVDRTTPALHERFTVWF